MDLSLGNSSRGRARRYRRYMRGRGVNPLRMPRTGPGVEKPRGGSSLICDRERLEAALEESRITGTEPLVNDRSMTFSFDEMKVTVRATWGQEITVSDAGESRKVTLEPGKLSELVEAHLREIKDLPRITGSIPPADIVLKVELEDLYDTLSVGPAGKRISAPMTRAELRLMKVWDECWTLDPDVEE